MRVTTQMLNKTAQRAGIPTNGTSMLNYINGGGAGSKPLTQALKDKGSAGRITSTDRAKYQKLEKAAQKLEKQADKFTATGEESLFGKAKASEDYTQVYREAESLVDYYNSTVAMLESTPGTMNDFYRRSMQELAADQKEALESIGITLDKRGKLQIDSEKLEAADKESIEKVLGKEGKFVPRLSYLAGRVEDNAGSNAASASNGYSAKGDFTSSYLNRYDYRG